MGLLRAGPNRGRMPTVVVHETAIIGDCTALARPKGRSIGISTDAVRINGLLAAVTLQGGGLLMRLASLFSGSCRPLTACGGQQARGHDRMREGLPIITLRRYGGHAI